MAKKKSSKKGGKKKSPLQTLMLDVASSYRQPPAEVFRPIEDRWKIMERHGGLVSRLTMWKQDVLPQNKLKDLNKSLREAFQFDDSMIFIERNGSSNARSDTDSQSEGSVDDDDDEENDEDDQEDGDDDATTTGTPADGASGSTALGAAAGGAAAKKEEIRYACTLFYDYEPLQTDCPLLLVSPRLTLMNSKT